MEKSESIILKLIHPLKCTASLTLYEDQVTKTVVYKHKSKFRVACRFSNTKRGDLIERKTLSYFFV